MTDMYILCSRQLNAPHQDGSLRAVWVGKIGREVAKCLDSFRVKVVRAGSSAWCSTLPFGSVE